MMRTTHGLILGALAGSAIFMGGCFELGVPLLLGSGSGGRGDSTPGDVSGVGSELSLDPREHRGSLGEVQDFDGEVRESTGYSYDTVTTVEMRSYDSNWAAMTVLTVEGNLENTLEIGTSRTYQQDDWGNDEYVSLLGCSGPSDGYWDYDQSADEVTIEVVEGANADERIVHYTGRWNDGSQVDGEFALTVLR